MANERTWRWSLALLAIAGLCGAALPVLLMWSRLPEPLAVHWGLYWQPDNSMRGFTVIWLAAFALLSVLLEGFSHVRVTADDRGLAVVYGRLGLRARFIPLAEIASASSLKLDPLEHGGWGYRGGLRVFGKAAIVVRAGDAVRLDLRDGKTLFVTVDDAATAAALLNGLIAQQPRSLAARS